MCSFALMKQHISWTRKTDALAYRCHRFSRSLLQGENSADDKLMIFFFFFQETGFDMSCKLCP